MQRDTAFFRDLTINHCLLMSKHLRRGPLQLISELSLFFTFQIN